MHRRTIIAGNNTPRENYLRHAGDATRAAAKDARNRSLTQLFSRRVIAHGEEIIVVTFNERARARARARARTAVTAGGDDFFSHACRPTSRKSRAGPLARGRDRSQPRATQPR